MKVTPKIIEYVITQTAGQDCILLYRYLRGKKNISEFILAEKLKTEINVMRNMLYRMYNNNLITFMRKKDKQKGWYIYYWTFNPKQIKFLLKSIKSKRIEMLRERLQRESSGNFYSCSKGHLRLDFEKATEYDYKCPECGELLHLTDNHEKIKEIEKEAIMLEKEIKKIK